MSPAEAGVEGGRVGVGVVMAETTLEGVATSIILSAISANACKAMPSGVEASVHCEVTSGGTTHAGTRGQSQGGLPAVAASCGVVVWAFYHPAPHQ